MEPLTIVLIAGVVLLGVVAVAMQGRGNDEEPPAVVVERKYVLVEWSLIAPPGRDRPQQGTANLLRVCASHGVPLHVLDTAGGLTTTAADAFIAKLDNDDSIGSDDDAPASARAPITAVHAAMPADKPWAALFNDHELIAAAAKKWGVKKFGNPASTPVREVLHLGPDGAVVPFSQRGKAAKGAGQRIESLQEASRAVDYILSDRINPTR